MKISFIGILTKPLKLKIFFILVLNLILIFLPAVLSANFLGTENLIYKILLGVALIISNGYLWAIFQHEAEEDDNELPKWNYINDFFIGVKGLIFFLSALTLFSIVILMLWFLDKYVPSLGNITLILAVIWLVYWLFMFNPVSMGIFSENFNPVEALKFSLIAEIINGCWLDYLISGFYMFAYTFILGMIGWACTIFFGHEHFYHVITFFAVYGTIVYFSLYAKVFRQVRTEFESHF